MFVEDYFWPRGTRRLLQGASRCAERAFINARTDADARHFFSSLLEPDSSREGVSRKGISGRLVLNHRIVDVPNPLAVQIYEPPAGSQAVDLDALAGSEDPEDRGGECTLLSDICPLRCPLGFGARERDRGFGNGGRGHAVHGR